MWAGRVAQKHLLSKKALSSNPSTAKKKKKREIKDGFLIWVKSSELSRVVNLPFASTTLSYFFYLGLMLSPPPWIMPLFYK
jgi:hypothetical protein